ncbi:WbqC family protein [Polluticoccus soli]|uniref:WbqC family protein n=1 Tax=Polluticoccus soli TaxID=3034150 RepID=UPI0023E24BAF|nr:WbqC family protein [Flavipsychrobacter sp. JY13-12]
MSVIVSPVLPFPNIYWWSSIQNATQVLFDIGEHFEKMSYRNKYNITGANGLITLSVPLTEGRGQRRAMKDVLICNKDRWQVQHWRTLMSVYKRAPYFEHYEPSLFTLFEQPFEKLIDFNQASIDWIKAQLSIVVESSVSSEYVREYKDAIDLRKNFKPGKEKQALPESAYYQMFSEKNGFYPNLSILDLLFSEGPFTAQWLKSNSQPIAAWR